jgi:hypothetical protein
LPGNAQDFAIGAFIGLHLQKRIKSNSDCRWGLILRSRVMHEHTRGTRTRTNRNPNGTEANAAGKSVCACVARESKREKSWGVHPSKPNFAKTSGETAPALSRDEGLGGSLHSAARCGVKHDDRKAEGLLVRWARPCNR